MITEGKDQGWLSLPVETLQPWAAFNNVRLHNVRVASAGEQRGAGVFATQDIASQDDAFVELMTVPRDLILSRERVLDHAKVDQHLRAVLDSLGDFGRTSRISILTFLLTQSLLAHPDLSEPRFVHSPFTTYIKLLPLETLPTFWTDSELALLQGTTLLPATKAKSGALYREFDTFRALTSSIPWCATHWWSEPDGLVSLADWRHLDAMYRSRALEFPRIGDCMAPCIDMANHAAGARTAAIYDVDANGDAVLLLRAGAALTAGDEVTISYGDAKGACEMLFSYGFLDSATRSAGELFLDLDMPSDDPLAKAKRAAADCPPGCKIVAHTPGGDEICFEGEYIWFVCANEEDGLEFVIQRTTDGAEELRALFDGRDLAGAEGGLKARLQAHPLWDVFQLRAASLLQDRVEAQLRDLYRADGDGAGSAAGGEEEEVRPAVRELAQRLRALEGALLEKTYAFLEARKDALVRSPVVVGYLAAMNGEAAGGGEDGQLVDGEGQEPDVGEEDFS